MIPFFGPNEAANCPSMAEAGTLVAQTKMLQEFKSCSWPIIRVFWSLYSLVEHSTEDVFPGKRKGGPGEQGNASVYPI